MVFEVGEEWVGVGVLGLLFLDFRPGAGEEEGWGRAGCCVGGLRSTGGRSVTLTDLYLSVGFDLDFLSRIRSPDPHLIFVLKAGVSCLRS